LRWLKKRARRFGELSWNEQLLLLRGLFVVAVTRAALCVCPLLTARDAAAKAARGRKMYAVAQLVWAVTVASRYVPSATCLTQALALHALLMHSGHQSRVEIGVGKRSRFEAHAWVVCDGKVVLGATEAGRYRPIFAWE
jgi:hypothetical protein